LQPLITAGLIEASTVQVAEAATDQPTSTATLQSMLEGFNTRQSEIEEQLTSFATDLANQAYGVDDIDGLAARFRQVDALVTEARNENQTGVESLQTALSAVEDALALIATGEFSAEAQASIAGIVTTQLAAYDARLASLETTLAEQVSAITAAQAAAEAATVAAAEATLVAEGAATDAATAMTNAATAQEAAAFNFTTMWIGFIALLALVVGLMFIFRSEIKKLVSKQKTTNDRVTDLTQDLATTDNTVADLAAELASTTSIVRANSAALAQVDERVTKVEESDSNVVFDLSRVKPDALKQIPLDEKEPLHVESLDGKTSWVLDIQRTGDDAYLIHGLLRRKNSTEALPAVTAANVPAAIRRAGKRNCIVGVESTAAAQMQAT